jgi:hypothetical protein
MTIKELVKYIAEHEGLKSQVKVGDVREVLGILSDLLYDESQLDGNTVEALIKNGKREARKSTCNWIFEVDYSINSKYPRFFVYSIKDAKLYKYKCAHGGGGKNKSPHDGKAREFSNVPGSNCSSLGVIKTGEHYISDVVGQAVRLNGLSPTNSKIASRGVVLHGSLYVFDNEKNTNTSISGRSQGCIAVANQYIDRKNGGELIQWLKDGSIGVCHYAGKFKL